MQDMKQNKGYRDMSKKYYLFAILNAFMNKLQAQGDDYFGEISWKQCFVLICLTQCEEPPALKELAKKMGCSHQNAKQMLLKLQNMGYIEVKSDEKDKRIQRIFMTQKGIDFCLSFDNSKDTFLKDLYEGVEASDMLMTIKTISVMDRNLDNMKKDQDEHSEA